MALDLKYKIIIVVFAAVLLLYVCHYFIQQLNATSSRKETFIGDDDVEHYEEPPSDKPAATSTSSAEPKYDLRILVLDDIEKLRIIDKDLKGKLMQDIFNEIDTLKGMNAAEREMHIKKKYDSMKVTHAVANTTATTSEIASATIAAVMPTKAETDSFEDPSKQLLTKTEEALVHLQQVQNGLQEIKTYANALDRSTPQTAPAPAPTPVPVPVPTPAPQQISTLPISQTFSSQSIAATPSPSISSLEKFVDGFENIVSYAPY